MQRWVCSPISIFWKKCFEKMFKMFEFFQIEKRLSKKYITSLVSVKLQHCAWPRSECGKLWLKGGLVSVGSIFAQKFRQIWALYIFQIFHWMSTTWVWSDLIHCNSKPRCFDGCQSFYNTQWFIQTHFDASDIRRGIFFQRQPCRYWWDSGFWGFT